MTLTPRLQTIYELLPEGMPLMDVGTDHCHLPIFALKTGKIPRAWAGDVRSGPLAAARANVEAHGLLDQVTLLRSNGLDALDETARADIGTFVFAGMGGLLIAELIRKAPFLKSDDKTLILQPMTAVYKLKDDLRTAGFATLAERIACEGEKLYIIIKAAYRPRCEQPTDPFFYLQDDPLFARYLTAQYRRFSAQLKGLTAAGTPDPARIAAVQKRLAQIKRYGEKIQ